MRLIFLIYFFLLSDRIDLLGQDLERQVIGSSFGSFESVGGVKMEWLTGQTITATFTENDISLTQGFLQPILPTLVNNIFNELPQLPIRIYPNPFQDWLSIKGEKLLSITRVQVISGTGQIISDTEGFIPELWDTSFWPSGLYFVQFFQKNQAYQPFLLIKNE